MVSERFDRLRSLTDDSSKAPMTDRRDFLRVAGGCLAHLMLQAACAPASTRNRWTAATGTVVAEAPFARLEAIGPGTWAVISTPLGGERATFANGGLIAGRSGVIAVEGFYQPAGATWLAEQSRRLTGRWPTHVVVTHYHVDHAAGVAGYAAPDADTPTPRLHATGTTRELTLGGGPVAPKTGPAFERAWGDVVIAGEQAPQVIDLGDRQITLTPRLGHTQSDLTVSDENASLLFSGDLVWNGMFPNFVDANPVQLRASVRAHARTLVPGHGARVSGDALDRYGALLDDLERAARAGYSAGTSAADVAGQYVVPSSLGEWMASRAAVERAMSAWYRVLG